MSASSVMRSRRSRFVIGATMSVLCGSLSTAACSLALTASGQQCSTDADCAARGGAFAGSSCLDNVCVALDSGHATDALREATADAPRDGALATDANALPPGSDWSCVGHVREPDATASPVTLSIPYGDLITHTPLPGIRVRACFLLDPMCKTPANAGGVTNEAGVVDVSVPSGFAGFLLSTWDAGVPALTYLNPPPFKSQAETLQVMATPDDVGALATALGTVEDASVTSDPTRGLLFLATYDCSGHAGANVHFSVSPDPVGAVTVYSRNGGPDTTATSTDGVAGAAVINVPVGTYKVTGTLATSEVIGVADGIVQAGSITFLSVVPGP